MFDTLRFAHLSPTFMPEWFTPIVSEKSPQKYVWYSENG